jgi:hypothetical protein
MLKVGLPGTVGDVEMQDLLFTTQGNTAGAVLVEWNIKAKSAGSAALWGKCFSNAVVSQWLTGAA